MPAGDPGPLAGQNPGGRRHPHRDESLGVGPDSRSPDTSPTLRPTTASTCPNSAWPWGSEVPVAASDMGVRWRRQDRPSGTSRGRASWQRRSETQLNKFERTLAWPHPSRWNQGSCPLSGQDEQPSMTAAPMHSHAAVRLALMSIGAGGGAGAPETSVEVVAHKGRVNAVPLSVPNVQVRSGVGRNTLD